SGDRQKTRRQNGSGKRGGKGNYSECLFADVRKTERQRDSGTERFRSSFRSPVPLSLCPSVSPSLLHLKQRSPQSRDRRLPSACIQWPSSFHQLNSGNFRKLPDN